MRLQELISIVRENFFLALIALIILGVMFFIGYFILYKKLFGGKRRLLKKQLLFVGMFIGYIIMVIGVTFLNRSSNYPGGMELSLFSSYREAWYNFSVRHWQFVILNIFMFVPFGILLPLVNPRFHRAIWTIGAALLFTLSIETFQLITGFGVFEVDDLFNNFLGGIIGYGMIRGFITIKRKGLQKSIFYFSPLLLVVFSFGTIFTYYHFKEFGNLSFMPVHKTNMTQATITTNVQPNDNRMTVSVYKAPSYTKDEADKFILHFFKRMNLDTSNMEVISYQDEGVYWMRGETSYNIWFRFLDGSYNYTDFSSMDEDKGLKDADEETLKENLSKFSVNIPQDAHFQRVDTGIYEWLIDEKITDNQLIDGSLTVRYYNDDTVKEIDNQLITYDKVREIQIKSEEEAYKEILEGKFKYYPENRTIETLHIEKIELSYYLDSKGYYQPVYAFDSTIDGTSITILIPGI